MKYFSQFMLLLIAVAVLAGLQYQYWLGENGHSETLVLHEQIAKQQQANDKQTLANDVLKADVKDLKTGLEAVEEHARLDLGLIKPNETFIQISTAPTTFSNQPADTAMNPEDAIEPVPAVDDTLPPVTQAQ